jgi:ribonuclease HI
MEGLWTIRDLLRPGDWMCTVDLSDAFHHVPIHRDHQRYFRFRFDGQVYQWRVMPFGYSDAPRLFTHLMRVVAQVARTRGLRVVFYLDDILLMSSSQAQATEDRDALLSLLKEFGLSISWKKSKLTPAQIQSYLGVEVNSLAMTLSLPVAKVMALQRFCAQLLGKARHGLRLHLKPLQRLLGRLQSAADCVLPTRLHLNALFEALRLAEAEGGVVLGPVALSNLRWWAVNLPRFNGKPIQVPFPDHCFDSDASETAWGAHYWPTDSTRVHCQGFFSSSCTSNVRELTAVHMGLLSLVNRFKWHHCAVRVRTDNKTTMSYVNRMGGRVPTLSRVAEQLHAFCLERSIHITAEYLPGVENVIADQLSRIRMDLSESQLNPVVFQRVAARFGPFSLDLFGSMTNTQLPRYISYRADPHCLYTDTFSRPLPRHESMWANPPFMLLGRLLTKIRTEATAVAVMLPIWPAQHWWPLAMELLVEWPVLLPRQPDLLLTISVTGSQPTCPSWSTGILMLSGQPSVVEAFRERLWTCRSKDSKEASVEQLSHAILANGLSGCHDVDQLAAIRSISRSLMSLM